MAFLFAASAPARAERPEISYMLQCRGCHLEDGSGTPGSVPAFADHVGVFLTIPGGREYLVRVPGSSQSPLSDGDLAAVLNWIVVRFGPPEVAADFEPFTAAEVARVRRPPLVEPLRVRQELLASLAQERSAGKPSKKRGSSALRSGER